MPEERPLSVNVIGVVQIVGSGISLLGFLVSGGITRALMAPPEVEAMMGSHLQQAQFANSISLIFAAASMWLGFQWIKLRRWAWFTNLGLWSVSLLSAITGGGPTAVPIMVINGCYLYFGTREPVCRAFGTSLDEVKSFIASLGGSKETSKPKE